MAYRLRSVLSEFFEVSRVPQGHGFPPREQDPQPDGIRLANLSFSVAGDIPQASQDGTFHAHSNWCVIGEARKPMTRR